MIGEDTLEISRGERLFRGLVLAVMAVTAIGLLAELWLLDHTEHRVQWVPFFALGLALLSMVFFAARPGRPALWTLRTVMFGCLAAGLAGFWYHYSGNVEFELEMYPSRAGLELFWEAMTGATPALAPGALAQLGLLGLVFTYKHPVLRGGPPAEPS